MVRKRPLDPAAVAACRALTYRLVNRRADLRMSQRVLARRLDWPQSRLSDLERGKSVPNVPTLIHWATALGVDLFGNELTALRSRLTEVERQRDIAEAQLGDSRALCYGHVDGRELDAVRATLVDLMGGPDMAPEADDLRALARAVGLRLRVFEDRVRRAADEA